MVCRKRSCYDTRNCFIDSLASCLHILQFVTWPISIFQADVDKNPSAPHTRLHFVMTWRMHGGRGRGPERTATFFLLPVPSCPPSLPWGRKMVEGKGSAFPPGCAGLGPCHASGSASPGTLTGETLVMEAALTRPCLEPQS